MAGSVYKKAGKWALKYELSRDPATGARRQRMRGGFATKKEADKELRRLLSELDQGLMVVHSGRQTVATYCDEWLTSIIPTVRPSTHHSYAKNIRLHIVPHIGAVPLQALDAGHLTTLYGKLLTEGSPGGHGALSARTTRYVHQIIKRALGDAVAWGRIVRNPADVARPPSIARARSAAPKAWSAAQLKLFLDRTRTDPEWASWLTLATTGARRGEILGLAWDDVDLDAGAIHIHHSLTELDSRITLEQPKTSGSRRRVVLDGRTVTALRRHRAHQAEQRLAIGAGWRNDWDLVFTGPDGSPVGPHDFSLRFVRRVKAAGLPHLSVHGLRHTWASIALEKGVHPKIVSERLGHASISITLQTYSHCLAGMDGGAAEQVAAAIFG